MTCDWCDEGIRVVCRICGREVNDRYSTHGVGEHIANPVLAATDVRGALVENDSGEPGHSQANPASGGVGTPANGSPVLLRDDPASVERLAAAISPHAVSSRNGWTPEGLARAIIAALREGR